MPALRLFGRKWLAASDDLVFPCVFEIVFRIVWLGLISCVTSTYWSVTAECDEQAGLAVRIYLVGTLALISINIVLLVLLVNRSAQGSITEVQKRRWVAPLLVVKILLILPETGLNVFGTMWAFCGTIECKSEDKITRTVIEAIVLFNWVVFALIIFGLAIVFDPLGSAKYKNGRDSNDNGPTESAIHRKVSKLWFRRFRWAFCCLRKDEFGHEAFTQVASLLSALFRGTDLVPSDIMAGCVLLRVRQKRETREMRRIRMLNDDGPRYSTDITRVFATSPAWMTIKNARHFLRFALAAYGWPMVCYMHCCTGPYRLVPKMTCCACFRRKPQIIIDDNCCLCHVSGVRYTSRIRSEDVLHASFKNHVFELPFCVLADHSTKSIVISIRGSLSMRDVFTDLVANAERFDAPGMPPDSSAHRGMVAGVDCLLKRLREGNMLERIFNTYPEYTLVLTGHSLGAGVSILLAAKLRSRFPDLRVYAFATPAGLLSREAARYTESYAFTIGVGDDFVMRLGVDSIENLRTSVIETIRACKLPKWRIMLNGFGYALFGVPSRDLETTWHDVTEITKKAAGQSPLLGERPIQTVATAEGGLLSSEISKRRFAKTRLYTGGRILHIVRRKKTELEKKTNTGGPTFEMRWATAEDFTELKVMPRMLLDHLPDNVFRTLTKILEEQKTHNGSMLSLQEI
ncbi:sn1-specific diacylglycerol lipase beta [Aedes aegypti]|uniref:sn-1-specific diacylglycerol lipase n=1 Tax=Aedes aegypti TaxID=7159 RepID=A0A1S4EW65_AEDAE|nr:sn1-specific diacylglycerol lipase beta [Aedes aegypti]XP_021709578.1 sn1-specific diacylglycerol lipase beta [Aedes aegypti]XP_021709579.1 sn1-specific diacylglycerol lipase beta [Aedes aegypti]XP_021709580.1 sn1-specific diacylglycerol lipase beta [Aedes aegypti]XP_021709581.1 sn1-specific diacylglycerol lipase beta [Aedes aegypti]XP_021709583.1 sn1-specific diacylglycerol lipase beta [Aedes aegypti]XP_021709584.1 sn1-specific diacylglycerol lipase beta [Aedes aegypti]